MIVDLCIDNFAGGGGASHGIQAALGRPIDVAINHDLDAITMHEANHPHTRHYHNNIWQVDPREVTQGRPVGLAWFSPDCKHFSKAKGGKPKDKKIRALANIVPKWAKLTDMRLFILENVEEFQEWGPVLEDGTPCPFRKGLTFRRWWAQLENLGFKMEMRELSACDYGAPTSRKRLFIIGRRDGLPIVWPEGMFGPNLMPYRTAADCMEWDLPVPSIFLTKQEAEIWAEIHGWKRPPRRPLADATLRRVARGIWRYVVHNPRPFIVPLTHQGSDRVHDIDEPFRTITGANRGELALACPTLVQTGYGERKGQAPRCLDIRQPLGTVVAQGNKHALVTAYLARHYGGHENDGSALVDPFFTVTAKDHHAFVTAHIQRDFGQSVGHPADVPLGSITSDGGGKAALISSHMHWHDDTATVDNRFRTDQVRAFLRQYSGAEQLANPGRLGIVRVAGEDWSIGDIGMRMLIPRELFRAQGFPDSYIIDPMVRKTIRGRDVIRRLSPTAQIRMCGNSVSPPVAEALVRANYFAERVERAA